MRAEYGYLPLHQQPMSWGVKDNIKVIQRADDVLDLRDVAALMGAAFAAASAARITAAAGFLEGHTPCFPSSRNDSSSRCWSCSPWRDRLRHVPLRGRPLATMVGQDTTAEQREQLREQLGLNDPFVVQYARFVATPRAAISAPRTATAAPSASCWKNACPPRWNCPSCPFMALALGIPMGIYTALKRHGVLSKAFMAISLAGISCPPS